jgi:hypothetical protein
MNQKYQLKILLKPKSFFGIECKQESKDKSSISTEEKSGISFNADGNLDIKEPTIDKPKLSGELSIQFLMLIKTKSKFCHQSKGRNQISNNQLKNQRLICV